MSFVWDFVKRHRNKIFLSGLAAGSVYIGQKYYEKLCRQHALLAGETDDLSGSISRILAESDFASGFAQLAAEEPVDAAKLKEAYIFDANQKACENTLYELLPSLKACLSRQCDVDFLLRGLHSSDLSEREKIRLWQQLEIASFTRLFATIYSYSLLILSLKIQLSITAAELMQKSKKSMVDSYVSQFSNMARKFLGANSDEDASLCRAHQIFLQAIQYFITQGCGRLVVEIHRIVSKHLSGVSLSKSFNVAEIRRVLFDIRLEIDGDYFSQYIVPLDMESSILPANSLDPKKSSNHLSVLLNRWKYSLENRKFSDALNFFVDFLLNKSVEFLRVNKPEWHVAVEKSCGGGDDRKQTRLSFSSDDEQATAEVPLAKIVPLVSDAFNFFTLPDDLSVWRRLINSSKAKNYCLELFEIYSSDR